MYEVFLSQEAEKFYSKQDRDTQRRLNKAIYALSIEPLSGPHIKKLLGEYAGKFRYALGGTRIIYEVDKKKTIVRVLVIRGRGDVYKR